jgi:hypothetical protein
MANGKLIPIGAYVVALLKIGDAPTLKNFICLASENDDEDFTNAL